MPLEQIAPLLPRTVIASEDGTILFPSRRRSGRAPESARRGRRRVGDARRLDHHPADRQEPVPVAGPKLRPQGLELPLALWIDLVLPKRRIMEIYLNIAEWGPNGEFGVEAGARHAFNKSARELTPGEAALLAAMLPNPVRRSARAPRPAVRRLAGVVQSRAARARLDRRLPAAAREPCLPAPDKALALAMASSISPASRNVRWFGADAPGFQGDPPWPCQKENLAVAARHAPLGRRAQAADLCRGQGFRRAAPPASHRPQDRHVQGPRRCSSRRPRR